MAELPANMRVMNIKKILSGLLAVFGGLAVVAVIIGGVWFLFFDDDPGVDTSLPDEALEGAGEEMVAVNVSFGDEAVTAQDPVALRDAERTTDRSDLIAFSIEEMIEGPDDGERDSGLYTELAMDEGSESICDGEDFSIDGEDGTFLIQLCRETINYGEGDADITALSQITQTLSQFPDVEQSVVLDLDSNCFADSDANTCYDSLPESLMP